MIGHDEPFLSAGKDPVEPFRINAGFIGFVVLACLPAIIALAVFFAA